MEFCASTCRVLGEAGVALFGGTFVSAVLDTSGFWEAVGAGVFVGVEFDDAVIDTTGRWIAVGEDLAL